MTTPAAVESDLGWALGAVMRTYLRTTAGALVEVPGGPRGYQVLTACLRDEPSTQLALARRLGLDRTVMTHLLDGLERAGLVERRADPAERQTLRALLSKAAVVGCPPADACTVAREMQEAGQLDGC